MASFFAGVGEKYKQENCFILGIYVWLAPKLYLCIGICSKQRAFRGVGANVFVVSSSWMFNNINDEWKYKENQIIVMINLTPNNIVIHTCAPTYLQCAVLIVYD